MIVNSRRQGTAHYYDIRIQKEKDKPSELYEGLVWYYPEPIQDVESIKDLLAFYDEKVVVWVDGEKQE